MPRRALTVGVVVALLVAAGAVLLWPAGEPERGGLTRAEAEARALDGAFYDRRSCPRPRRVSCEPAEADSWSCTVVFPSGASATGDPQPTELQSITALC